MNIRSLCSAFAANQSKDLKAGNVYTRGPAAYSYGPHFPLAYIRGSRAFVNADRYSASTSRQQSRMRGALSVAGLDITERDTTELRELIANR